MDCGALSGDCSIQRTPFYYVQTIGMVIKSAGRKSHAKQASKQACKASCFSDQPLILRDRIDSKLQLLQEPAMGLDGGTIATRSDILRRSSSRLADGDQTRSTRGGCISHQVFETAAAQEAPIARFRTCALSGEALGGTGQATGEGRVVICRKGLMYNKSAFEDYILREGRFGTARAALLEPAFHHLRGPRDVVPASIAWNREADDVGGPLFHCPATMVEANGSHRFSVVWRCGCVVSARVLKRTQRAAPAASDCPGCGRSYAPSKDVVELFPEESGSAVHSTYGHAAGFAGSLATAVAFSRSAHLVPGAKQPSQGQGAAGALPRAALTGDAVRVTAGEAPMIRTRKRARADGARDLAGSSAVGAGLAERAPMAPPKTLPAPRPLPRGWERLESKSKPGMFYYRNAARRVTQWEAPA